MDADGLPIVGAGVDYTKVDPFHQKRTLAFLNHFLIRTTSFLNHFAAVCDEKLENLLVRIQRLEASMSILEAKLASIPGLEDVTADSQTTQNQPKETQLSQPQSQETVPSQSQPDGQAPEVKPVQQEPEKPVMTISQDPRFAKYFKMVNMGVLPAAVKQKMGSEGVNPDLLNDPDAPAPPGALSEVGKENSDSDSSEFSD